MVESHSKLDKFKLGIISDEVSDDFARSCALIRSWGLTHVELRMLWGKNVLQLSAEELGRAERTVREHGLQVTAIASPIFKSPLDGRARAVEADFSLPGSESFEAQVRLLERACDLCELFGTRLIRVFTFWKEPWSEALLAAVASKLLEAASVAQTRDVVLAVENEPVCNVGSGRELGELCRVLSQAPDLRPHLGALWDPGNALAAGETSPYPEGYGALRACNVVHVHLKDLTFEEGRPRFAPVGNGHVDYEGQLQSLASDGYDGAFVLEPHYRPDELTQEEAAHACVEAARDYLERYFRDRDD